MADISSASQASTGATSPQHNAMNTNEPPGSPSARGRGRGRGRGQRGQRGRGGRGRGGQSQEHKSAGGPPHPDTSLAQSYGRPPGGGFGARLTEAASLNQGEANAPTAAVQNDDAQDDAEVCFICASPIEHTAIGPCNHQTCHICALRLRALYKTRACAHCRVRYSIVLCHIILI